MKKYRIGIIVFALVVIIAQLSFIDYNDLTWENNSSKYLGIISMVFLIAAMISSQRYVANEKKKL